MSDSHVDHCTVFESLQSNISNMAQVRRMQNVSHTPKTNISTNDDEETNWIYSSFRSLKHCICHRFYIQFQRCFNILALIHLILMIISLIFILLPTARMSSTDFLQLFHDHDRFNESPQFLSTLQQKMEQMETEMGTIKAQQNIDIDFSPNKLQQECTNSTSVLTKEIFLIKQQIANISEDAQKDFIGKIQPTKVDHNNSTINILKQSIKAVDTNVLKMESNILNISEEIQFIKKEMQTIHVQEEQNTNAILKLETQHDRYTDSILELRKKISLLQREIDTITSTEWNNLKRDYMQKITAIQSDFTEKYLILETRIQNIENMDKTHSNFEPEKFQQTVDIWEKFMLQQNEMNHKLLTLLQSNNNDRVTDEFDPVDFASCVVYHTEIMSSSITHDVKRKLYYFFTRNYDQNAVRPTAKVGDCTPLKQYEDKEVYIIFRLREHIFVDGITIEYIRPSLVQNNVTSAPQNMTLELSKDGYHYYNVFSSYFLFNPSSDGAKKYFQFKEKTNDKYRFAKLNVISNFGATYSCLYRVQIHGNPHSKL